MGVQVRPDAPELAAGLAAAGWDASRVRAYALAVRSAGEPWPHQIPDALRAGLGPAQLHAALGAVRETLGVATLDVQSPSKRTALNADERRLLGDVPPHFGRL